MSFSRKRVLIAGVSTRAAAESAARAGFSTTTMDAFADLDQHPKVRVLPPPEPYSPNAAVRAMREVERDAAVYVSGFENHPRAVSALTGDGELWGNPPTVLRRVRDPVGLAGMLRDRGHAVPAVFTDASVAEAARHWLMKPIAAGGGHGIRRWHDRMPLPRGYYLQEEVEGTPGSVAFVAAAGRAATIGISRQLIGESAFGAGGYRYCGSILMGPEAEARLVEVASSLASAAAESFDLIGVNCIDFVGREGVPYPVELNPRWSASMELIERAFGLSVFGVHVEACTREVLPAFELLQVFRRTPTLGKAVVFAKRDVTVGDTRAWLEDSQTPAIRDIPPPGQYIRAGRPVCTVFADGFDDKTCYAALVERAEQVYAKLAGWSSTKEHRSAAREYP